MATLDRTLIRNVISRETGVEIRDGETLTGQVITKRVHLRAIRDRLNRLVRNTTGDFHVAMPADFASIVRTTIGAFINGLIQLQAGPAPWEPYRLEWETFAEMFTAAFGLSPDKNASLRSYAGDTIKTVQIGALAAASNKVLDLADAIRFEAADLDCTMWQVYCKVYASPDRDSKSAKDPSTRKPVTDGCDPMLLPDPGLCSDQTRTPVQSLTTEQVARLYTLQSGR